MVAKGSPTGGSHKDKRILRMWSYLKSLSKDDKWWIAVTSLTVAAFATRLSYLHLVDGPTWDEVHFGGFANQYINRTFYHDVHPPLGKILVAAAAYITGYKGNFNFTSGDIYDQTIRYQLIRAEFAAMGALLVPISFATVYELTNSVGASTLGALGVLCDTFVHKITCLILLDPLLLLAISLSVFSILKFHTYRERPYCWNWWAWLTLTGVLIGIVMSIKYVGIFTVTFVGIHTINQLFWLACDPKIPLLELVRHTLARVICLIFVPVAVYLATFVLHFAILTETSPNAGGWLDTRMFAAFNNTEYDNKVFPKYVNYGANITIMSSSPTAGYLDSWFDLYPSDLTAPCQIVAILQFRDPEGVVWRIRGVDVNKGNVIEGNMPMEPPVLVRNGDFVVLTDVQSERSLRSHGYKAPFTRRIYQVCGYGDNGQVGPFETWKLVIPGVPEGEPLKVFEHDFLLKHFTVDCYLQSTTVNFPNTWTIGGGKEVGCTRNPRHPGLLWHINWIDSQKVVGETAAKEHAFGMWKMIWSLHQIMFKINSELRDEEGGEVRLETSYAWMWPLAYTMQLLSSLKGTESTDSPGSNMTLEGGRVTFSSQTTQPIFAVAAFNPLVAYVNIAALLLQLWIFVLHMYKQLRVPNEPPRYVERRQKTLVASFWLTLCWGIHYIPFFFMNRVLYIHHYCPAFLYSCMITGIILNYVSDVISDVSVWKGVRLKPSYILAVPSLAFVASYVILYPMATFAEGEVFERVPRVNAFLDLFYFGQRWVEFGYKSEYVKRVIHVTKAHPFEEENIANPDVNATLYYMTSLDSSRSTDLSSLSPMSLKQFLVNKANISVTGEDQHTTKNQEQINVIQHQNHPSGENGSAL